MAYDLQLSHIGKVYDNGTPAVIDFNLDVEKGEFIAFLGPSGCGKTTTLRMIAGFETITSGDLMIRGKRVNDLNPEQRPTSMIFQNYALFPHMNVRQNIRFGLEVKGMAAAEADRKVDRIIDKLGLSDVADMRPNRLSGGQRQRIALARSLVVEPDILLLDEPLGALDANLRKSIQNELKLLQRELGITFVFVTHAQSEALALSDRIVVMNHGRVEQIGTPAEIYDQPASPFVMSFVGAVNVLPQGAIHVAGNRAGQTQADAQLFFRPHDVEVFGEPQPGTVEVQLKRLSHLGRDLQAELLMADGQVITAQIPRDQMAFGSVNVGSRLYVRSREAMAFVPDYSI